ncbi:hypothetical protein CAPTEDRAFT_202979 [Capitella teleta]|uniref:Uncharacterized protein n=1 Tax=Capitella teleta TaxID=283909 RepID=R7TNH0_CAPTE|nr:hypothetical protein CAPTEDRAFT_202979 [Capitella teleta]|eukprot:ELT95092.1 hypothetical protein CAPTEDRAFT_202979 [Capitella teleta]
MNRPQFIRARIEVEQRSRRNSIQKLMEQTGMVEVCNRKQTELEWYRDARSDPTSQAAYLGKLAKLRKELLEQDKNYSSKTLRRLQETEDHFVQEHRHSALLSNTGTPHSPRESLPERHKRLLAERQRQIEIRRQGRNQPTLKGLVGRSLTTLSTDVHLVAKESDRLENDALSWEALTMLVQQQTNRLPNSEKSLKPQYSIPNIGRRALKNPELSLQPRDETFIRQMSLHEKDSKGLYKGKKRRNLMAADKDEVDLSPHTFRFDLPAGSANENGQTRRAYHPGCVSPVTPNTALENQKKQVETQKHQIKRYFNPRQIGYTPARVMYLPPMSFPIRQYHETPRPMLLSIPVQLEILSQFRKHTRHEGILTEEERSLNHCLFCQNPSLSMVSIGLGQYIMTHIRPSNPEHQAEKQQSPEAPPQSPVLDNIIDKVGEVNSACGTPRNALTVELPSLGADAKETQ